ncbi:competence protein CoiA [Maribellus sediminis]|uniref:competence protein CoiA n=1 Tax=Maribellus sediminis TaxID=2696285 RepID=UPI00142F872E|nr:competence protein CoiA family protein [Maribellus sediminis]
MKYALVSGKKTEATKGSKGICPNCGSELTARCGPIRINHWTHTKSSNCDIWWENEKEWHRAWKNYYPDEWQEIIIPDVETGEKHIADVRTNHGLVIEFQHSHIDPEERNSRESFYKNMVWIVDGTRLKRDYLRFLKGQNNFRRTNKQGFFIVDFPDECFPSSWIGSKVPVLFDFRGLESIENLNDLRNYLYCLFPNQNNTEAIVAFVSHDSFIKNTINGDWFKKPQEPQKQVSKTTIQNKTNIRRRESSHYYDPQKGRYVKKRRF